MLLDCGFVYVGVSCVFVLLWFVVVVGLVLCLVCVYVRLVIG